jgi:hypothetical protein
MNGTKLRRNLEAASAGQHVSEKKMMEWILFKFWTEMYAESILLITAHYAIRYKIYGSTFLFYASCYVFDIKVLVSSHKNF